MMLGHVNPEKHNQVCEYIAIFIEEIMMGKQQKSTKRNQIPHVTIFARQVVSYTSRERCWITFCFLNSEKNMLEKERNTTTSLKQIDQTNQIKSKKKKKITA